MVSLMVILFSPKCFLFVYMYIDILKLKAYKLFENSDGDLSWLFFFKEANLFGIIWCNLVFPWTALPPPIHTHGKKSCVSTGVGKTGNTCASPTAMI